MGVCVNKVFSLLMFFTFSFSAPGGGCCSSYVFAGSSSEETSGNAGIAAAQPEPGQVSELGFPGSCGMCGETSKNKHFCCLIPKIFYSHMSCKKHLFS